MDDLDEILIIKVFYDNKNFEIKTNNDISLEEIKKKCVEEIKYNEKDINKITLWYIDEEHDKNLINDSIDLIKYSKEIEFSTNVINLTVEINNKDNYKDNKELKKNKNEEEEKEKNINIQNNTNININKLKSDKNENIQKLNYEIKLLKDEVNYYKERIKNIIQYYEDFLAKMKNKYEKDLIKSIQKFNMTIQDLVNEKINHSENTNINQNKIIEKGNQKNKNYKNEKKEEGNHINKINENEKKEEGNKINNINKNEINEENNKNQNEINEGINEINIFNKAQTIVEKKNDKIKEKLEDINDKKLSQLIDNVENNKKKKVKKEKEKKEKENIFNLLNTPEGETPIINNKLKENGKDYNFENIEFINNKCNNCKQLPKKINYKCVLCDNYFLCEACHKICRKNKFHEHFDFFEIRYPNEVIKQMQEKITEATKLRKTLASFYGLLNFIFFDKKGDLLIKEFNKNDVKSLKPICKDMKSVNADPMEYYSEYKLTFINAQLDKLNEESREILSNKIKTFFVSLEDSVK